MVLNVLFCPTNSPKPKNTLFNATEYRTELLTSLFERLHRFNFFTFYDDFRIVGEYK